MAGAVGLVVTVLGLASGGAAWGAGISATRSTGESRSFITSDGARLHYLEAGPTFARTVVFVPGWTMPGWIFAPQIEALQDRFHVVALDPRGQGESDVTALGYTWERRGRDIGELIDHIQAQAGSNAEPVVLVGWSLGVLDSLAYLAEAGDAKIAGLVLIDNSVGEEPAPIARPDPAGGSRADAAAIAEAERRRRRAAFVASMFAHDPGADYRARLIDQALRMTQPDERRLLAYDVPREFWRAALHSTDRPVLYAVRPRLRAQGDNLVRTHADARMEVFETAGHALFVDEAERFDALLIDFLDHAVAPAEARRSANPQPSRPQ